MTADNFISKIDSFVKRRRWGNDKTSINWKTYSDEFDNDASIYLNEESLTIKEFVFRSDLRENNLIFLKSMIVLGLENEWLFFDRNGKLMKPNFAEIKNSLRESNAYRFLKDPIKFLENIDHKNG